MSLLSIVLDINFTIACLSEVLKRSTKTLKMCVEYIKKWLGCIILSSKSGKSSIEKMGGKTGKKREQVVRIKVGLYPLPLHKLKGNHMGPPI